MLEDITMMEHEKTSKMKKIEELRQKLIREKKVIPGTNDRCFKSIMNYEKDYLAFIISEAIGCPFSKVKKEMNLENTELPLKVAHQTKQVKDLVVTVGKNVILVEMNPRHYGGLYSRNHAYISGVVTWKINKDEKYDDEVNYFLINIDDFRLNNDKNSSVTIRNFQPLDKLDYLIAPEHLKIMHISLPKLRKKYYNKVRLSDIEKAYLMLGFETEEELTEVSKGNKMLKGVKDRLKELRENYDFLLYYDEEKYKQQVQEALIRDARQEERRAANRKIDRVKREKELEIAKEKIGIAKRLLKAKVDPAIISQTTGFSMRQIAQL